MTSSADPLYQWNKYLREKNCFIRIVPLQAFLYSEQTKVQDPANLIPFPLQRHWTQNLPRNTCQVSLSFKKPNLIYTTAFLPNSEKSLPFTLQSSKRTAVTLWYQKKTWNRCTTNETDFHTISCMQISNWHKKSQHLLRNSLMKGSLQTLNLQWEVINKPMVIT